MGAAIGAQLQRPDLELHRLWAQVEPETIAAAVDQAVSGGADYAPPRFEKFLELDRPHGFDPSGLVDLLNAFPRGGRVRVRGRGDQRSGEARRRPAFLAHEDRTRIHSAIMFAGIHLVPGRDVQGDVGDGGMLLLRETSTGTPRQASSELPRALLP